MRQVSISDNEELEFAKKAKADFDINPLHHTYGDLGEQDNKFIAIRWGLGNDCILVLRLDTNYEPTIYTP